jgi:hypothetical protein
MCSANGTRRPRTSMPRNYTPAGTKPAVVNDLALLAGGHGGQVFWRSYCRLTALFCVL